jgi:hypothetical protein
MIINIVEKRYINIYLEEHSRRVDSWFLEAGENMHGRLRESCKSLLSIICPAEGFWYNMEATDV